MVRPNTVLAIGLLTVLSGVALLAWAVSRGEAELYLVVIIPVISGTGPVFAAGALLFMVGLMVTFVGYSLRSMERMEALEGPPPQARQGEARPPASGSPSGGAEFGGVVFIGPVPIVFGRGQRASRWMLVASVVFGILLIVFILGLFL
jgi:uncharacterized protein (TIGR00304 family)